MPVRWTDECLAGLVTVAKPGFRLMPDYLPFCDGHHRQHFDWFIAWPACRVRRGKLSRLAERLAMRSLPNVGLVAFLAVVWIFISGSLSRAQQATELEHLAKEFTELQRAGRYSEAIPIAERILSIHERPSDADQSSIAIWLNNIGELYRKQGRFSDAEPLLQRALAIREKTLRSDHLDVGHSLNNLAMLYQAQGRYSEAGPLYLRSSAIFKKALGPNHPNVATSLNNLAFLYQSQGRYEDAERLHRQALAIREKALGRDHPDVANSLNNLAIGARLFLCRCPSATGVALVG